MKTVDTIDMLPCARCGHEPNIDTVAIAVGKEPYEWQATAWCSNASCLHGDFDALADSEESAQELSVEMWNTAQRGLAGKP